MSIPEQADIPLPFKDTPSWLATFLDWLRAEEPVLSALAVLAVAAAGGWRLLRWVASRRGPKREVRRQQQFADHIESQLRRLDDKEEWRDYRFARLEAEVEAEGRRRGLLARSFSPRREGLRRERSLLDALVGSRERLVIVQGDPGAGKSVALRKVAKDLARQAMHSPRINQTIPLYINLKEFRPASRPVDAAAVREFVLAAINQANSRDVDRFLEAEFDRGMAEGTWLFLFDSFDEIPDVLSADRVDETVEEYADALFGFLHAMNACRGVIASREFRGPYRFGWPRFTIQRLSRSQQRELIEKADLPPASEQLVIDGIAGVEPHVGLLTGNPMLLGLLCEHVRDTGEFPNSSHTVFETFVASRLRRDADRLNQRFRVSPEELRSIAEEVAFHLTADESLGLSPARTRLAAALAGAGRGGARLDQLLDALEYIKLARAPEGTAAGAERPFTFAHRRFQEYFATCAVIQEPGRVSSDALLLDGRWRETAVTMLQTQPAMTVAGLVADAERMLVASIAELSPERLDDGFFPWPANSRHLLALLDAGAANRPELVPDRLRVEIGGLLVRVWGEGRRIDRKWAVAAAGLAGPPSATLLMDRVFATDSTLLHQAAYQQAGRFIELPAALAAHISRVLVGYSATGQMWLRWPTIAAQLRRLADPSPWLRSARLLRWVPVVDLLVVVPVFVGLVIGLRGMSGQPIPSTLTIAGFTAMLVALGPAFIMPIAATVQDSQLMGGIEKSRALFLPAMWAVGRSLAVISVARVDVWPALQSPVAGYRVWLMAAVVLIIGGYLVLWPPATTWAVLRRRSIPLPLVPLLPAIVLPAIGQRLRRGLGTDLRWVWFWLTLVLMTPILGLFLIWEEALEARDRRLVRALPRERQLYASQIRELVGRLRTRAGMNRLAGAVRRQQINCGIDAIAFLEDLAARADAVPAPGPLQGFVAWRLRRPRWIRSPESVPEYTRDQIALLSEERLRLPGRPVGHTPAAAER